MTMQMLHAVQSVNVFGEFKQFLQNCTFVHACVCVDLCLSVLRLRP